MQHSIVKIFVVLPILQTFNLLLTLIKQQVAIPSVTGKKELTWKIRVWLQEMATI